MRRTKIVATLGPATESANAIQALLRAGVAVFRLNFSHGDREWHGRVLRRIREAAGRTDAPVAVLADLGGPKIRVGTLPEEGVRLVAGGTVVLRPGAEQAAPGELPVNYAGLADDVASGARILLDDGRFELRVVAVEGGLVRTRVRTGGVLVSRRGVNVPGARLSTPSLTEKDRDDLAFALAEGVDFIGLSFVRDAGDVARLREAISAAGSAARIVAKVETAEAVARLREIIEAADAVMVARGDLGVEIGPEAVPIVQKDLILECRQRGRPVITATQMLESMQEKPRPTRAEASDVANAVYDGTDAVMLSGETSIGRHPLAAVRMMARIARRAERHRGRHGAPPPLAPLPEPTFGDAVGRAAAELAERLHARVIVAFTKTGRTAERIARWRPRRPVAAFTPDPATARRLELVHGVRPARFPEIASIDELLAGLDERLIAVRIARPGDAVVVAAGAPVGTPGRTNLLTLHRVGGGNSMDAARDGE